MSGTCIWNGCEKPVKRKSGHCEWHYRKSMTTGPTCSIEGCSDRVRGRGWCGKHWQRWRIHGDPLHVNRERNREYGDTRITSYGYVLEYVPGHPQARDDNWCMQHRRVMSDHLGRALEDYENVHHKNGSRQDNRLENLELWVVRQPAGQKVEDLVEWAEWILERYR